ncbi:MAG: hypothetical protein HZA37_01225 [Parcubacteria group bacterium]|nr:hypothetical protein [Parcubacteria group bacterium]
MKYFSPNHDVVINASGGYAVLERLGFKPETQTKEGNVAKKKKALEKKAPAVKSAKAETAGLSRNELMEEVKSRGIKNFRVMNKAELAEIVGGAKPERIEAIQKEAVARWKSGWTKK